MSILQIGVPKCGNFWLYQIIQQILKSSGRQTLSYIERQPVFSLAKNWDLNFPDQARIDVLEITELQYSYRISSIFQMPIENIGCYIKESPHIWTHSPICKRSFELYNLISKKVYIIRDPRDRAISASKYYCSPYMLKYFPQEEKDPQRFLEKNFDSLMHEWVWHVFDHLKFRKTYNIHITFFERLLADFQKELGLLLNYMEIDLSSHQRMALENAVQFSNLKEKNPKHLKKGTAGYWREHLTDKQIEQAEFIAGPLLRYLQYSSDEPAHTEDLDFEQLKLDIIRSQELLHS